MKKIYLIFALVLSFLCIFTLSSCENTKEGIYHTVTFDSKGGTEISSQRVKHGEKASIPEEPSKEGYDFQEWKVVGQHSDYGMLNLVNVTEDLTLEAVWSPILYGVFAENCPFNNGRIASFSIESESITLPLTDSFGDWYPGYTVIGWYKDAQLKESISQIPNGTTGDILVYPKLTPIEYQIKYFVDNEEYNDGFPTTYTMESESVDLSIPEKDGFLFSGWLYNGQTITNTKQIQDIIWEEIQPLFYRGPTTWNLDFGLQGSWISKEPTEYEKAVNALLSREKDGLHLVISTSNQLLEYDEDETYIYCIGNPVYDGFIASCRKDGGNSTYVYLSDGTTFSPIYGKQSLNLNVFIILQQITGTGKECTYQFGANKYPALSFNESIGGNEVELIIVNKEEVTYIVIRMKGEPAQEVIYKVEDIGSASSIPSSVKSFYDEKNADHLYFLIQSDSMNPMFKVGEYWLFDTNISNKVFSIGDVIAFTIDIDRDGNDEVCIHRIVNISDNGFTTKGDNNSAIDNWIVTKEQIIGFYSVQ